MLTEEEVYQRFLAAIREAGSQRAFARKCGFTVSYINDIVNKRRAMSDHVLRAVGIRKTVEQHVIYREMEAGE